MPWLSRIHQWLRRRQAGQKRALIAAAIAVALLGIAGVALAIRWPFTERKVLQSIRESWPGDVHAERVRSIYFPHPGCEIENLVLTLPSKRSSEPADITITRAQLRATYVDLFLRPGYLAHLLLEGLRIEVPAHESNASLGESPGASQPLTTSFGEVETHDAILIIKRSDEKQPLRFDFHRLALRSIRRNAPMSYDAELSNALPPGEIRVHGQFGPWESKPVKDIALRGSYVFEKADLSVFQGIAGRLSSSGSFDGALGQILVTGTVDIPSFQVTRARHDVALSGQFQALVNGTNGDVTLQEVDASFLRTTVHAKGTIQSMAEKSGNENSGKTASLDLTVKKGQIHDVLKLFVKSDTPPMSGTTDFQTHVVIPPGEKPFLKKLGMAGTFSIANAVLSNPERQNEVDLLSKRASGHKNDPQTDRVSGQMNGTVVLENAIATFMPISFGVPGADILMTGRYNLLTETVDFHGDAKTQAPLSGDVTGAKAILLKPLNSLFKKKHAGADVRVGMTGTYDDPHFGIELPVKK